MLSLLSLLLALPLPPSVSAPQALVTAHAVPSDDLKTEYEKRRSEADGDVKKLWEVVNWCEANSLDKERRSCLRAIVKIDDEDRKAHELLGHTYYDGRWFTTDKKLASYKKKEAERLAKEQGLVPYKDGYAHPDDIPFLEKGLVKDASGKWVDPEEAKRLAEGWRLHDLTWISPEEFEQEDAGKFKCGDNWLSPEEADKYHSELGKWWTIPGRYFHIYTTLPREVAIKALDEADRTFGDLKKIYGFTPTEPIVVVVLRSGEQYNLFAGGREGVWPGTDIAGLSSIHGAFFADGLIDYDTRKWYGAGAAFWDYASDTGNQFGPTFVRHAAGQSYAEKVDPSPKAVGKFEGSAQAAFPVEDYYGEKNVPAWFRYGAAVYVERYFTDAWVGAGGDPLWARKWSISNIASKGGLDPIKTIFDLSIGVDNESSGKLINQAGLLIAFIVDGKCAPVAKAHGALKAALREGKKTDKAFKELEEALAKNVDQLRMFADL